MTKTSKANLLRLILTTKFKKEYLKTQASEKGCFFCVKNWAYGLWLMAYGLANVKFEKTKKYTFEKCTFCILYVLPFYL